MTEREREREREREKETLPALKMLALQFLAHELAGCSGVELLFTSCAETDKQTWSPSHCTECCSRTQWRLPAF